MHITRNDVERIADLARLYLSDEEKDTIGRQLDQIVGYVQKLKTLHTEDVEATATVAAQVNVFREDDVGQSLSVEQALLNAPESRQQSFCVPRVIQES